MKVIELTVGVQNRPQVERHTFLWHLSPVVCLCNESPCRLASATWVERASLLPCTMGVGWDQPLMSGRGGAGRNLRGRWWPARLPRVPPSVTQHSLGCFPGLRGWALEPACQGAKRISVTSHTIYVALGELLTSPCLSFPVFKMSIITELPL